MSISCPAPDRGRRQLHRAGVRADVPPVRQRGDDHRDGPAAGQARRRRRLRRHPGDSGARRHPGPPERQCIGFSKRNDETFAQRRLRTGDPRRSAARTSCSPWAAVPTPTISAWKKPASTRRARLHHGRRPTAHQRPRHLGAGRLQRARAPSPTLLITTSKSSPPICSTTIRAASAIASPPMRFTSIRRSAASA